MFRGIPLVQGSRWYMGSLGEDSFRAFFSAHLHAEILHHVRGSIGA